MPRERILVARPEHEVAYQDIVSLCGKHKDSVSAEELLAIAANMLGKFLAYQDQRTMTKDRAMEIVIRNIEIGNQQVITELLASKGTS
jgi:hypothetical protein